VAEVPGEVVSEHAEEHVRADALGQVMIDGPHMQVHRLETPERATITLGG